jgi:cysteine synthase
LIERNETRAKTRCIAFDAGARPGMEGNTIVVIIPSFAERCLSTALFEGL